MLFPTLLIPPFYANEMKGDIVLGRIRP